MKHTTRDLVLSIAVGVAVGLAGFTAVASTPTSSESAQRAHSVEAATDVR